jgi:hypothetical protein
VKETEGSGPGTGSGRREAFAARYWRATLLSPYPFVAMAAGVLLTLFIGGGYQGLLSLAFGGWIGLVCYLLSISMERVFHDLLLRMAGPRAALVRAILFSLAGLVGFLVGQATGRFLFLGAPLELPKLTGGLSVAFGASAALAVFVGLPVTAYELMKRRLAESIERLKAAEFAEKELELARTIQQRLLPPATLEGPGFAVAARCLPARHVGGDFYDVFHLEDGKLGLAVADVAGKGMGAALIMATAKAVVPLLAVPGSPALTLAALSQKLHKELGRREFVALAFGIYDAASGELRLANAGLPDPYVLRPGEPPRALSCPGPRMPLGLKQGLTYEELRVTLSPGDRVVFVSDGLPEAPAGGGEPLGYTAFEAMLDLTSAVGPEEAVSLLLGRVGEAASAGLEDDATVLLLERRPMA